MAVKKVGVLIKDARTAAGLTQEKLAKAAGEKLTANDIGKCERGEIDLTAAQLKRIAVACGVTQKTLLEAPKNLNAAVAKKDAAARTTAAKAPASTQTAAKAAAARTSAKTAAASKAAAEKALAAKKLSTAAKTGTSRTAAKPTAAKSSTAKATVKTTAAKKTASAVPANANVSMKVTATEQKLIQAYRESTSDRKKAALKLLKGEYGDAVDKLLSVTNGAIPAASSSSSSSGSSSGDIIGEIIGNVLGGLLGGK